MTNNLCVISLIYTSSLLALWRGLVSLKEQVHALPEAVVPDTVDDDVTAAVSSQNPEGKKGKVTPHVPHHVPQHKQCDGRERRREGERQYANRFGGLDVRKGRPVGAASGPSVTQAPLREQFAFPGVPSNAGERHDVNR